uniref:Helicase subunit n=3 Tax=Elephant endotheliotropic herpesvirus 1A TaxID=759753 RepID=A0A8B6NQ58_ELHV1|nr:helicase subunit [Elephant endotheliotropic herpesvirus 1A]WES72435.1 helicase subunit [Elephantid betaherpesvirus 1]WES72529.1 helicase subunit [Elephantid betaherpesvirus 1]WNZ34572.1 helicase subunit [Elephant endotheliotropic herpesvirus 1A]
MMEASTGMFDTGFFLNMCSASKVERIVDKVRDLAGRTLDPEKHFPYNWVGVMDDPENAEDFPFCPFTALAITGTAGAGKTASVQVLAANLKCLCTGATVIAAQNLSSVLNRSKAAQVRTIHKEIGFNSRHVSMVLRDSNINVSNIEQKQRHELSRYWTVVSDITNSATENIHKIRSLPLCKHNIIVIDEAGVILEHMLHAVVFMYWFYNALCETPQYKKGMIPCVVCIGSPTQSEAIITTFDHSKQNNIVRRGRDILSALICDPVMVEYCKIENNWVLFINNKRCTDPDFGNLLKHIEFGLPLTPEHLAYVDRFVRPGAFIKDPQNVPDMTRLFISHNEVQEYYRTLHGQLLTSSDDKRQLFTVPIYCILNVTEFDEYLDAIGNPSLKKETWFEANKTRIWNYSQFADQDLSNTTVIAVDREHEDEDTQHQIFKCEFTYIRNSAVSVSSKLKSCIIGFEGSYNEFVEIIQKDLFLESVPYEQINYAYSFLTGLLYSGMFAFYTHEDLTHELLVELRQIPLPNIDGISRNNSKIPFGGEGGEECAGAGADADAELDRMMCDATGLYNDMFYESYDNPPVSCSTFEETIHLYTTFKDIFLRRYYVSQKHTNNEFGHRTFVTYNRRNVSIRNKCEIVSHSKSFIGLLSYTSPARVYTLQGYTHATVMSFSRVKNNKAMQIVSEKNVPRLILKDALGFMQVLEHNISYFTDIANGRSFSMCTAIDYGISPKIAMTITKSQGLSLDKVAVHFGDGSKPLKLNQIYVAISRVTNPNNLILNINPLRSQYINNNHITRYIAMGLKNPHTYVIY